MIAENINQNNFCADLYELQHRINSYLELRDRCDDPERVDHQLDAVVRNLKANALLYTDLADQVMAIAQPPLNAA